MGLGPTEKAKGLIDNPCPLCGNPFSRELYRHRGRIVQCRGCGLTRRDPIPSPNQLRAIYVSTDYFRIKTAGAVGYGDYFADEAVYRPYFRQKFNLLARYRQPSGKLCEVGAAAGYALDEARLAGWDVAGLELSPSAAEFARRELSLPVREGGIDDLEGGGSLDVVVAFQTIEHLPDVRAGLARIREALRVGGLALMTTPDHGSVVRRLMRRFWPSYRPEHLVYFDRPALRRMLRDEGFVVELLSADAPLLVPVRRIVERAAHYYVARHVDVSRVPKWRVPVWLGDMTVIARRI